MALNGEPDREGRPAVSFVAPREFVERGEPPTEEVEDERTARIVARFQAGDRDAFGELYLRYFDRVYNYLRLMLRDPHGAEEATQDVFIKALGALPEYRHRAEPFRAWLFVIARNVAVRELRIAGRLEPMDPAELDRHREETGEDEELEVPALEWISDPDLVLFVERLPLPQQQVLAMRYLLGLGTSEIAAILGETPNQVAVLQSRALKVLRERLSAIGRGPLERRPESGMSRWPKQATVLRKRRFSLWR